MRISPILVSSTQLITKFPTSDFTSEVCEDCQITFPCYQLAKRGGEGEGELKVDFRDKTIWYRRRKLPKQDATFLEN